MKPIINIRHILATGTAIVIGGCSNLDDPLTQTFAPTVSRDIQIACGGPESRPYGLNYPSEFKPSHDNKNGNAIDCHDPSKDDAGQCADAYVAREHAINYLRCYTARTEAESVRNDIYDIPIIGAVIATVGTGAFNSGKTATATAALTGGGLALLQQYDHPDTTLTTDLGVVQGLECVIDATHTIPLDHYVALNRYVNVLEVAQRELRNNAADLQGSSKLSSEEQQWLTAVDAAIQASTDTITALRGEISAYQLVGQGIYTVTDKLDMQSRIANKRTQTYAGALAELNSAIKTNTTNQSSGTAAKASATTAKKNTAVAKAVAATGKADAAPKAQKVKTPEDTPESIKKANPAPKTKDATTPAPAAGSSSSETPTQTPDQKAYQEIVNIIGTDKTDSSSAIDAPKMSSIDRLVTLAEAALNAIPTPSYTDMNTSVAACGVVSSGSTASN